MNLVVAVHAKGKSPGSAERVGNDVMIDVSPRTTLEAGCVVVLPLP